MLEIFKYTERVVNMIRPRKLLFMAIGGSLGFPRFEAFLNYYRWCRSSCEDESTAFQAFSRGAGSEGKGGSASRVSPSMGRQVFRVFFSIISCQ
jgi:5'-3' exonuclease